MNADGYNPVFDLLELNRIAPRTRFFHQRRNFEEDDDWTQRYRLQESSVNYLIEKIGDRLYLTSRLGTLSPRQQLLTALRFFSSNAFYHVLRDSHGPSESTNCRVIRRVTQAINETLFDEIVQWPSSCEELPQEFFRIGGMPSTCGAVDGTLIPIVSPSVNEHQYVDRHKKVIPSM